MAESEMPIWFFKHWYGSYCFNSKVSYLNNLAIVKVLFYLLILHLSLVWSQLDNIPNI